MNSNTSHLLSKHVPSLIILSRYIDRVAYASDASFYSLLPELVVQPKSIEEIIALINFCKQHKKHLTFRSAGTSLSGQAVTDGILVDLSKAWKNFEILEKGKKIKLEPGIIGQHANNLLKKFGRKIGPDPASINACMLGGIIANNASGMCCGLSQNSYQTLSSIKFVLPSGNSFDTQDKDAEEQFWKKEEKIAKGLTDLRKRILENPNLVKKIKNKYSIKNTTGYGLNSFLDFEKSIDIFSHLLVGSEGTLGFIAEVILDTVPDPKHKLTGLLLFPDLESAGLAISPLSRAAAIEIMDYASLLAIKNYPGIPESIKNAPKNSAALLVEYQAENEEDIELVSKELDGILRNLQILSKPNFTKDSKLQLEYWKIRKGLFPAVGATKPKGSTVIIEDVAVPVANLPEAIIDLQNLYTKYNYDNAITFGHAKDGNLHFVITPNLSIEEEKLHYSNFMSELVELISNKYNGSLKAEHGTGRNIAPFVETEWGEDAYLIMKELKSLVDPLNIFNPGVIINEDKESQIKNTKLLPEVEEEVDKCIECGFCEPKCPSRNLSLSPRQRIVIRRELKRLDNIALKKELQKDYQYAGLDTCAADSLCELACPVSIDTGALVKRLRSENQSKLANTLSLFLASNFTLTQNFIRLSLIIGHALSRLLGATTLGKLTSFLKLPRWGSSMPRAKWGFKANKPEKIHFVYYPSCVTRTMKDSESDFDTTRALVKISEKAGINLLLSETIKDTCCGQAFSSKGFKEANEFIINKTIKTLWHLSEGGKYSIVSDTSPCSYSLKNCEKFLSGEERELFKNMQILDISEYLNQYLVPKLDLNPLYKKVLLHPVCSIEKMGLRAPLEDTLKKLVSEVVVPKSSSCCGFAGDKGFTHPELTASALEQEAKDISLEDYDDYVSTSFTCELGLSRKTGKRFKSVVEFIDSICKYI